MTAEELQDYRDSLSILSAPELAAQLGEDPEMDKIIQGLLDAGNAVDLKSGSNIGADDGEADDVKAPKQPDAAGDDDDDGEENTFVDEHGRPVADPNSAEAQAAAAAIAAAAEAGAAAPAPAGDTPPAALPPLDLSFLDTEHQAKLEALDAAKAEAFKKLMGGEIEPEEYSKAESQYMRDRDALVVDKQDSAAWATEVHNFKAKAAESGVNYFTDQEKHGAWDEWVKRLASNPANADKSGGWFLEQAHKKVLVEFEITPQAAPAAAKTVAAEKIVAKPNGRAPNLSAIPPTLGAIPAATSVDAGDGGEFAHLDNLNGMAYERAIAALDARSNGTVERTVTTKRLMMDVKVGESIQLGDGITITVEQKSGQLAKLCIQHNGVDIRRLPDRRQATRQDSPGRRVSDGQQ